MYDHYDNKSHKGQVTEYLTSIFTRQNGPIFAIVALACAIDFYVMASIESEAFRHMIPNSRSRTTAYRTDWITMITCKVILYNIQCNYIQL